MKKIKLLFLSMALVSGGSFIISDVHADTHKEGNKLSETSSSSEKMQDHKQAAKKSREVSGTIIKKKTVKLPGDKGENIVVMLKTDKTDDRLIVDLGDKAQLEKFKLDKNSKIKAEGRLVQLGTQQFLVARNLNIDGKTVKVNRSKQSQQQGKAQAE